MKFFTIGELISSFVFALAYGALGGLFASLIRVGGAYIISLSALPRYAYKLAQSFSIKAIREQIPSPEVPRRGMLREISDFFTLFIFGLGFLLLSYIYLDGEIRLYMILLVISGSYITNKTLGEVAEHALLKIFSVIQKTAAVILVLIIIPVIKVFSKILFPCFKKAGTLLMHICTKFRRLALSIKVFFAKKRKEGKNKAKKT